MALQTVLPFMYAGAKAYWPNITEETFDQTVRSIVSRLESKISVIRMEQLLRDELIALLGTPNVPFSS